MMYEYPKIMQISISNLYTLNDPKIAMSPLQTSKKCFAHGLWMFRQLFDSLSQHFDVKNTFFDVFFMFFDSFGRFQLFDIIKRRCAGPQ